MGAPSKYSHQREAIVEFLKTRKDHPTADVVYQNMRSIIPNISLGTVYRNLNQLADAGQILRIVCDGKTDHFDGTTQPHCHFMCKCCGAVSDIDFNDLDVLLARGTAGTAHHIEGVNIVFHGKCAGCISSS